MAISSSTRSARRSSNQYYWTLSLNLLIISTGVVSMAVIAKLSIPLVSEFLVHLDVVAVLVPPFWNSLRSWLKPPYVYVLINAIIIVIVLSSRSSHHYHQEQTINLEDHHHHRNSSIAQPRIHQIDYLTEARVLNPNADDDQVASRSVEKLISVDWTEEILPENLILTERNSVTGHRRAVSCIHEAGDTLESTWKMITENRSKPQLKKSDTWERSGRQSQQGWGPSSLMRSEPLKESDHSCLSLTWREDSGRFWRESSLSEDELNRRAEAFIQKVKADMRLQREESLNNQYLESINGVTD